MSDYIEGERHTADFDAHRKKINRRHGALLVGISGVAIAAYFAFHHGPAEKAKAAQQTPTIAQVEQFEPPKPQPASLSAPVQPPAAPVVPPQQPPIWKRVVGTGDPLAKARQAPLLGGVEQVAASMPIAAGGDPTPVHAPPETELGAKLHPTVLEGSLATVLAHPDMTVTMGTLIPCVLDTALDSSAPGMVVCTTQRDTFSTTGTVVLMPKGTKIVGEYATRMSEGEDRLFVLWDRAETPDHVIITLSSPASDALGRGGFGGFIDTHFWERMKGALLLTMVDGAFSTASSALSARGGTYFDMSPGQSAATEALQGTINIRPTIKKNQGEIVAVMVARDLDFSTVYSIRVACALMAGHNTLRLLLQPIQHMLDNEDTTEVCVNRPGEIMVENRGEWLTFKDGAFDYDRLDSIATLAAAITGQDVGPDRPLCATTLPDGQRLQVCRPPATAAGIVSLTIRRPPAFRPTMKVLAAKGMFKARSAHDAGGKAEQLATAYRKRDWETFLSLAVLARKNIVVAGATGTGKTTTAAGLADVIPRSERLITIEDTPEWSGLPHENRVALFYSKGDQGMARVRSEDLLEASLRMRPDRVLMQELRDGAAFTYVRGVAAGHPGSITTCHAGSAEGAFEALRLMVRQNTAGATMADADVRDFLRQMIDVVVHCERQGNQFGISGVWWKEADDEHATA